MYGVTQLYAGDLGVTAESVDVGSCSSVIDSQPGVESCVQSQVTAVETLLGDGDVDSVDTSGDLLDDAMICIGYDTPCQILGDDSYEILDESQDQCLQDLTIEVEAETCGEIEIARASISSEELFEVHSSCISDAKLCKDNSTCISDLVVDSSDSISYHSAVSETRSLHRSQGLQRHHVTYQLKVSDSDIYSSLDHYDAIRHMLATFGWGAPVSNKHSDSSLSLAEVHALREAVRILKHSYSQLVDDRDYLLEWGSTCYEALLGKEKEVVELTWELEVTVDSLLYT